MGKHKPTYNPSDPECGDYVVVVNASNILYSKKTYEKKVYYWHTGWPGGLKKRTLKVFASFLHLIIGNGAEKSREDFVEGRVWNVAEEQSIFLILL